ncbi:MAG: 23S rRNA (uracil(1939)-C(5))-methyltransferase RlmD, partial [Anaerovorax sp.]|nr:23S rRNA (uracil(1939)-C(5))-methyltransferase RlmD [Anaerovorax sp.]
GKPTITDQVGDLVFEISPKSFYQVNPVQMKVLYDKVVEFSALTGEETVLDLYCGVGTIGLYCASKAKRIIGIESEKAAVIDANRNAVINGIVNAEYICGKSEEVLPKRLKDVKADVVILDPPRVGCHAELLEAVLKVDPKRIVYVSCDPATLARDIKVLGEGGYSVKEVQPVDMFPWTGHCEVVTLLQRIEK